MLKSVAPAGPRLRGHVHMPQRVSWGLLSSGPEEKKSKERREVGAAAARTAWNAAAHARAAAPPLPHALLHPLREGEGGIGREIEKLREEIGFLGKDFAELK